jgi:hypothetical protein
MVAYPRPLREPAVDRILGAVVHLAGERHDEQKCLPAIVIASYGYTAMWYDDRWSRGGLLLGIVGTSQTMYHTEYHTEWECPHRHPELRKKHVVESRDAISWIPQPGTRRNRQGSGPRALRPLSSETTGEPS